MEILAHRGLPFEYPENTLPSFEESLKCGFGIETDIRKTKDGILVLCHDQNVKRGTGIDKNIKESTFKELKNLNFNYIFPHAKANICTLDELIKVYKKYNNGRKVAFHIKVDGATEEILSALAKKIIDENLQDLFFVFDLTLETAKNFKKKFPSTHISISVGEKRYAPSIYLLEDVLDLAFVDSIWADEWVGSLYSEGFFNKIKRSRKLVYVISPELHIDQEHPLSKGGYEEIWDKVVKWNVDGICTDYPKEFLNLSLSKT